MRRLHLKLPHVEASPVERLLLGCIFGALFLMAGLACIAYSI